jgi:hypothetical protein
MQPNPLARAALIAQKSFSFCFSYYAIMQYSRERNLAGSVKTMYEVETLQGKSARVLIDLISVK